MLSDGRRVGDLWIGPLGDDPERWWVWDIVVVEELRGRGYGRNMMLLAEELAQSNGATSIGLNVFARNHVARSLYTSLGYEETSVQMRKGLSPAEAPVSATSPTAGVALRLTAFAERRHGRNDGSRNGGGHDRVSHNRGP